MAKTGEKTRGKGLRVKSSVRAGEGAAPVAPRETGSGMATGRRQHEPVLMRKRVAP